MRPLSLYIHIPYCLEKCPYCDFHSVPTQGKSIAEETYANALLQQLEMELERLDLKDRPLPSLFFGGGTPSLMSSRFFDHFLQKVPEGAWLSLGEGPQRCQAPSVEITVETNPAMANRRDFKRWLEIGINRISFGAQSFQGSLLKRLGRHHTAADSVRAVQEAKEAGFTNINCDLIFGIESQTLQELEKDLQTVMALDIPHVSAYQLTVEPNTPLHHWVAEGKCRLPQEERLVEMHEKVVQILQAGGLHRYEVSNYAKTGFECRHNLNYWHYGDYLGIGSGAVSKVDNRRWRTTRQLKKYLKGCLEPEEFEIIDARTAWKERWMMGIRLQEGIRLSREEEGWREGLAHWEQEGFLLFKKGVVCLTPKGFLVSNRIIQNVFDLIDEVC